jgi:hypothetical protein
MENNGVPLAASAVTRLPTSIKWPVITPSKGAVISSKPASCSNRFTAARCVLKVSSRDSAYAAQSAIIARPAAEPRRCSAAASQSFSLTWSREGRLRGVEAPLPSIAMTLLPKQQGLNLLANITLKRPDRSPESGRHCCISRPSDDAMARAC